MLTFIKDVLYNLTREYGENIVVTRILSSSSNYTTGERGQSQKSYPLKKVIRLPDNSSRLSNLDFFFRKYTLPSTPDQNIRRFIIFAKYAKGYEPLIEDVITMGDKNYRVTKIEELENKFGYYIEGAE